MTVIVTKRSAAVQIDIPDLDLHITIVLRESWVERARFRGRARVYNVYVTRGRMPELKSHMNVSLRAAFAHIRKSVEAQHGEIVAAQYAGAA